MHWVKPFTRTIGGRTQRIKTGFLRGGRTPMRSVLKPTYRRQQHPGSVRMGFWLTHSLSPRAYVILTDEIVKAKRVYVPQSPKHKAYTRMDPRTKKIAARGELSIGDEVIINSKDSWLHGEWGIVNHIDADFYHVAPQGDKNQSMVFNRKELRKVEARGVREVAYDYHSFELAGLTKIMEDVKKFYPDRADRERKAEFHITKIGARKHGMFTWGDPPNRKMIWNGQVSSMADLKVKGWQALLDKEHPNWQYEESLPKGTPGVGEMVIWQGHWAEVVRREGDTLVIKAQYNPADPPKRNVDPNAEYKISFSEAVEYKRKKADWDKEYEKFFQNTPIAQPRDEKERQLLSVESKIRHLDHENAKVYDYTGRLVVDKHGDYMGVNFTPDEERRMYGCTLTHNHPQSASFSPNDVFLACFLGLKEIRAVTPNFVYVLKPPKGFDTFPQEMAQRSHEDVKDSFIDQACQMALSQSYKKFFSKFQMGEFAISDMVDMGWDDVWQTLQRKLGFVYERYRWSDATMRAHG